MKDYEIDILPVDGYDTSTPSGSEDTLEMLESISVVQEETSAYMEQIAGDVRVILTFIILTFCWSAVRAWRKNFSKGV